jgi:hypothetical protein
MIDGLLNMRSLIGKGNWGGMGALATRRASDDTDATKIAIAKLADAAACARQTTRQFSSTSLSVKGRGARLREGHSSALDDCYIQRGA